jgi:hypothetical protein
MFWRFDFFFCGKNCSFLSFFFWMGTCFVLSKCYFQYGLMEDTPDN